MMQLDTAPIRVLPPRAAPIVKATDLGSVQVLKHGNRFLLTDSFGDIHPDSRGLGLYHGDTRVLACSVLRVGGSRPVLLQTSVGANYRGGIQLTNPSADRNPDAKVHPVDGLVGRTIGISRERLIGGDGVSERVKIVNHAGSPAAVPVDLELGADGADIFEVRGYPRRGRGRLLPLAATDRRITFSYVGLDDIERFTHIAFSEPAVSVEPIDDSSPEGADRGAAVRLRWTLTLGPGETRVLSWTVWCTDRPAPPDAACAAATAVLISCRPGGVVPRDPARVRRRGCRGLSRLVARNGVRRQRPRAVQPRHQALRVRPPAARERRPG